MLKDSIFNTYKNMLHDIRTAGKRQLKVPVFFMEEHLSKEQVRLEAEAVNAAHFMENDYERSRKKFEEAGTIKD